MKRSAPHAPAASIPFERDQMLLRRLLLIAGLAAACSRTEAERRSGAAVSAGVDTAPSWRLPGDKVDSILPMPEYLRRFREGLTEPSGFSGGADGREELARRFLAAVSAQDTAALVSLLITRAEFGWLVFPHHTYASPPYELDPAIFWLQLTAANDKGWHRMVERVGGDRISFRSLGCRRDTLQIRTGPVRVWGSCDLRYHDEDSIRAGRLFGSIVELNGRFKLMSLGNDF